MAILKNSKNFIGKCLSDIRHTIKVEDNFFEFLQTNQYPARLRASLFYQEVCRRGHLLHPNGNNVMLAHSREHAESLLEACAAAMEVVANAADPRALIWGAPISPEPVWRAVQ